MPSRLASIPALRRLAPAALAALDRDGREVRFAAGDVVRPAGRPVDAAVLLLSGIVVATCTGPDGRELWLERWVAPAIADKPAILGDGPPPTGLAALDAMTAFLLPRSRFLRLLAAEPSVREHDMGRLGDVVVAGRRRLADAVTLPATVRVAAWLATRDDAGPVAWRGTQEDLARLLGLSRVTVNRALASLAGAGAVRTTARGVEVTDRSRLVAVAQGT